MTSRLTPIVVLGAGPAGLGAAFRLGRRGAFDVTVIERNHVVGGNAGSFILDGYHVDYGSHRLHPTCGSEILEDIRLLLGDDLLDRPRHGRIRLQNRWVHFPLKPLDLAAHLPPSFAFGVLRDSFSKIRSARVVDTFAGVLERQLGSTICREFYFPTRERSGASRWRRSTRSRRAVGCRPARSRRWWPRSSARCQGWGRRAEAGSSIPGSDTVRSRRATAGRHPMPVWD